MKKILFIILGILIIGSAKVSAREFDATSFAELGVAHAYVTGDIIFDVSGGFTPNLKDIMEASRTIKDGEPTKMYDIIIASKYGSATYIDLYANKHLITFPNINCRKIFAGHIDDNVFKPVY